jgi:hypothetical protein
MAGAGASRALLVGAGYPRFSIPDRSKGEKLNAYFDKARFCESRPKHLGHARAKCAPWTGFANADLSVAKGCACRSSVKAAGSKYRFEAFNALNATHLANPVTGPD